MFNTYLEKCLSYILVEISTGNRTSVTVLSDVNQMFTVQ